MERLQVYLAILSMGETMSVNEIFSTHHLCGSLPVSINQLFARLVVIAAE